jgi:hypothetical protein
MEGAAMAVQLLDQIAWVAKRFGGQALLVAAAPRTASMRGAARDDPRSAHYSDIAGREIQFLVGWKGCCDR